MKYYKISEKGNNPQFIGRTGHLAATKTGMLLISYFNINYKEFHSFGNFQNYEFDEITRTDEINHWKKCFETHVYEEYTIYLQTLIKNILHEILY